MKVPPKRKGNFQFIPLSFQFIPPSMKVPPKRKGNLALWGVRVQSGALNESPSEKEGKWLLLFMARSA